MKNIRTFYVKNCHFLMVKFSVYLNRRVFVMAREFYLQRLYSECQQLTTVLLSNRDIFIMLMSLLPRAM